MHATGPVCPRNRVAVATVRLTVVEYHCIACSDCACEARLARHVANAIMLMLNVICCRLTFVPLRGQHCTAVETQATITASTPLKLATAVSRNGRLTDMLPFTPGSFTFIRDVTAARASTASARYRCS